MAEESSGLYPQLLGQLRWIYSIKLAIEVVYVAEDGTEIFETAEGRGNCEGGYEEYPCKLHYIRGMRAFDMDFLDNDASAQRKLTEWYNAGKPAYLSSLNRYYSG